MNFEELTQLIDRNCKKLFSFCRYLTLSKEDAEDLYQDTLLLAVRNCGKINPEDNPDGFLASMAVRIWKSNKRKYARRNRIVRWAPLDELHMEADESSMEENLICSELSEYVRSEVERLGERYSIPIYLYYTMELEIGQIAGILRIPEGTVKSRLHTARTRLRQKMEVVDYAKA